MLLNHHKRNLSPTTTKAGSRLTMSDNEPSTSASPSTSTLKEAPQVNGTGKTSGTVTKRVQVVGAPPAFHGTGRKEEEPRKAADSDEEEEQPDEDALGIDSDDKTRTVGDGEVKDEDLLAEFDEDEDVSSDISRVTSPQADDMFRRCI